MREGLAEYVPQVYRFALRLAGNVHQAEDLTQETFLRTWRARHQLKDEKAVRVWLFRIAANVWNDGLRRSGFSIANPEILVTDVATTISPGRDIENREELSLALKQLNTLPSRQRAVLYLTAVEEMTIAEVCDILQISSNDAKVNLSLARKRMRAQIAKHND